MQMLYKYVIIELTEINNLLPILLNNFLNKEFS
jgi:hypothetical protein